MIILLPPSEGKEPGGTGTWRPGDGSFGESLEGARKSVMAALPKTGDSALKVRGAHAEHARKSNAALGRSGSLHVRERYCGVVYQGLDYPTLSAAQKRVANRSIVVVSGLAGLVAFNDTLPDYRAPIDASVTGLGKLASFWKPELEDVLRKLAKRHVIVDVLPQAHRSAMTPVGDWRRVDIVNAKGVGGHAAKFAKGRFVRWLLDHQADEISRWREDGWRAAVR